MQSVEVKDGVRCWADAVRYGSNPSGYGQAIVYLSLFGPHNAVRAAWARLVGGTKYANTLNIGRHTLALDNPRNYVRLTKPLPGRMLHLVLAHQAATSQVSVWSGAFVLLGNDLDVFYARLSRGCVVPMLRDWAAELFAAGLEEHRTDVLVDGAPLMQRGPITELEGFGERAYKVSTDAEAWGRIVGEGVRTGRLPTQYGRRAALLSVMGARMEALGG